MHSVHYIMTIPPDLHDLARNIVACAHLHKRTSQHEGSLPQDKARYTVLQALCIMTIRMVDMAKLLYAGLSIARFSLEDRDIKFIMRCGC